MSYRLSPWTLILVRDSEGVSLRQYTSPWLSLCDYYATMVLKYPARRHSGSKTERSNFPWNSPCA